MAGLAKAILVTIIGAAALFLLTHLAFLFPFYMTVVAETFNLANVAANDNYVKETYWENSLDSLIERPIFEKSWGWKSGDGWDTGNIRIKVTNANPDTGHNRAVGSDYEFDYNWDGGGPSPGGEYKPYCQRGEPIRVTVSAAYPLEITLWGRTLRREVPLSFSITTMGLKYYKDLDYEYLFD